MTPPPRPSLTVRSRGRDLLVAMVVMSLAGCTVLLGFDKEVSEEGRGPGQTNGDGSVVEPGDDDDDASDTDALSPPAPIRGVPDQGFGTGGMATVNAEIPWSSFDNDPITEGCSVLFDGAEAMVVACAAESAGGDGGVSETRLFQLTKGGQLVPGFAGSANGIAVETDRFVPLLAARPNGAGFYAYGMEKKLPPVYTGLGKSIAVAHTPSGSVDTAVGSQGVVRPTLTGDNGRDRILSLASNGAKLSLAFVRVENEDGSFTMSAGWLAFDPAAHAFGPVVAPSNLVGTITSAPAITGILQPTPTRTVLYGEGRIDYARTDVFLAAYEGTTSDPTFGDAGIVLKQMPGSVKSNVSAALEVPEGYAVVTGSYGDRGAFSRYDRSGTADLSVVESGPADSGAPEAGMVRLPAAGADPPPSFEVHSVLVEPDRKVIIGGTAVFASKLRQPLIMRISPDGRLDESFGRQGMLTPNYGATTIGKVMRLAYTPAGRLLAVGTAVTETGSRSVFVTLYR